MIILCSKLSSQPHLTWTIFRGRSQLIIEWNVCWLWFFSRAVLILEHGRGATRAEDAQGTPTQSHISPRILAYVRLRRRFEPIKYYESLIERFWWSDEMAVDYIYIYIHAGSSDFGTREGCRESRKCSMDTYPESYIIKYTSIKEQYPES